MFICDIQHMIHFSLKQPICMLYGYCNINSGGRCTSNKEMFAKLAASKCCMKTDRINMSYFMIL